MRRTTARTAVGIATISGVIAALVTFGAPSAVAQGTDDVATESSSVVSDDGPGHDLGDDHGTDATGVSDDGPAHDATDDSVTGIHQRGADDIDGDGLPNDSANELDVDGDGLLNPSDRDIDGDSLTNRHDRDMDGDGIRNGADDSPRGAH